MSTVETLSPKLFPSYISKIWRIDTGGNKPLLIPRKKLRWPVTSIINKIISPILTADIIDTERLYYQKIHDFQELWPSLLQFTDIGHKNKQDAFVNLAFYDRTLKMIKKEQIFGNDNTSITETIESLKDFEITIQSILNKPNRISLLEEEINSNEIEVNDLFYSLYGSYLGLVCFWIIARNSKGNERAAHKIAKIIHKLAISLDSYTDTLDIMTNPDEIDIMKHSEKWERQKLKREQALLHNR